MTKLDTDLILLMEEVLQVSYTSVIERHTEQLNYRSKKYAQLRLMGIAHALFRDMLIVCSDNRSARTLELLHRPLLEIWINFLWIGLGNSNKNYVLYVIDDNLRMAKHTEYIIKYLQKIHAEQTEIDDWVEIRNLNLIQAADATQATTAPLDGARFPNISERARDIDKAYPSLDGSMEWMVLYPYSFAHRAIHSSNSHLNRLNSNQEETIDILGSDEELDRAATDCLLTFMGLLEDYGKVFKVPMKLQKFWDAADTAKILTNKRALLADRALLA